MTHFNFSYYLFLFVFIYLFIFYFTISLIMIFTPPPYTVFLSYWLSSVHDSSLRFDYFLRQLSPYVFYSCRFSSFLTCQYPLLSSPLLFSHRHVRCHDLLKCVYFFSFLFNPFLSSSSSTSNEFSHHLS